MSMRMNFPIKMASGRSRWRGSLARAVFLGFFLTLLLVINQGWAGPSHAHGDFLVFLAAAGPSTPVSEVFEWRQFLAPFHSVMLHFPIGFVTLAFLLDLYYLRHRKPEIRQLACGLMVLCAASSLLVVLLGLLRASGGGYEAGALESHRFYGILLAILIVLAVPLQRFVYRHEDRPRLQVGFRVLTTTCMLIIVVTGHKGGNLTHGSNYLTKNAPQWVKKWMAQTEAAPVNFRDSHSPKEQFFLEKIQPVLESKCFQCHGPEKQKGEYRLDMRDVAYRGGESGETAIKPGAPLESLLVEVILLARDDDYVMPPEGKTPLTPEETMNFIRWIQDGAVFVEKASPAPLAQATP
jgi:uncharacterized membrane protein